MSDSLIRSDFSRSAIVSFLRRKVTEGHHRSCSDSLLCDVLKEKPAVHLFHPTHENSHVSFFGTDRHQQSTCEKTPKYLSMKFLSKPMTITSEYRRSCSIHPLSVASCNLFGDEESCVACMRTGNDCKQDFALRFRRWPISQLKWNDSFFSRFLRILWLFLLLLSTAR